LRPNRNFICVLSPKDTKDTDEGPSIVSFVALSGKEDTVPSAMCLGRMAHRFFMAKQKQIDGM
jgi:hypothetical protein